MPSHDFEEVDAYGRIVPRSAVGGPLSNSRGGDVGQNDRGRTFPPRGRSNSRGRGRYTSRSPPRRGGDYRQHQGHHQDQYHHQHQQHQAPRPIDGYHHADRYYDEPVAQTPARPSLMPPVASYRNFIMTQSEGLTPEAYQQLYENYQRTYAEDFSDAFFRMSMSEEWFQDRYNPINIVGLEKESADWAAKEAMVIKDATEKNAEAFVRACCLDPSADLAAPSGDADNEESGRQLSGYTDRAIYVTHIHACCTRAVFKQAVALAVGMARTPLEDPVDPSLLADRVLVSHPSWSHHAVDSFERTGWVIFKTAAGARRGLELLRSLEIKVPGPVDTKGEPTVAFSFVIHATPHVPQRSVNPLPDYFSTAGRLRKDLELALHLAELLDEQRSVPEQCRLSATITSSALSEATRFVSRRLDVCAAYLRRVHFVSFFQGKRMRDEAHLLISVALPVLRSLPAELVEVDSEVSIETPVEDEETAVTFAAGPRHRVVDLIASVASASTQDAEDAVTLQELQEKDFSELVHAECKFEADGKCRCCFEYCRKLFKAYDFLSKHMRMKHPEFGLNILLKHAEGFMRKRYEAEELVTRPLPPVEVEGTHGVESRSVGELLQKGPQNTDLQAASSASRGRDDRRGGYNNDRRDPRDRDDYRDRRDHRDRGQLDRERDRDRELHAGEKRKVPSYVDVDVPKESVVSVDYGVAVAAPVKRRRVVAAAAPAKPAAAV